MEINIQILLYNSSPDLEKFLKSMHFLILKNITLNFYLVDQSENIKEYNKVNEIIKEEDKLPKPIRLYLSKQSNFGFGKGHNEIYRKNKEKYNDFFVILNPDSFLMYDTFSQLARYLQKLEKVNWGLLEIEQFPNEHPKFYDPKSLETPWASAAGLVIRKKSFESLGMFDENIFMYGEDVDLSIMMRKNRYKVLHLPECKFVHLTKDTDVSKSSDFTFIHKQAAELYLRYKHGKDEDVKQMDDILRNYGDNYEEIRKKYEKMIENYVERSYYKGFVDEHQDYTKFRWVL